MSKKNKKVVTEETVVEETTSKKSTKVEKNTRKQVLAKKLRKVLVNLKKLVGLPLVKLLNKQALLF